MENIHEAFVNDIVRLPSIERVFQKHIIDGPSYFFKNVAQKIDDEYQLRDELAKSINVNINDVIIVGSAKLGFSIKSKELNLFDAKFESTKALSDRSDIDIAIINKEFFDKTTRHIFSLSRRYDKAWIDQNWTRNDFYRHIEDDEDSIFQRYCKYVAMGWLRPDLLPLQYHNNAPWGDTVTKWKRKYLQRKISVGIYSDWFYLKNYQIKSLETLKSKIEGLEV